MKGIVVHFFLSQAVFSSALSVSAKLPSPGFALPCSGDVRTWWFACGRRKDMMHAKLRKHSATRMKSQNHLAEQSFKQLSLSHRLPLTSAQHAELVKQPLIVAFRSQWCCTHWKNYKWWLAKQDPTVSLLFLGTFLKGQKQELGLRIFNKSVYCR